MSSSLYQSDIFDAQDLNSIASVYVQPCVLLTASHVPRSRNRARRATSILVTHFLLDLQQASRRTMYLPATNTENWEKVLGSLVLVELELEEDCDALVPDVHTP